MEEIKNTINLKEMGKKIQKARKSKGFTQEYVANIVDISVNFYSDIELGKKGVSIGKLANICVVLDLSLDYIIFNYKNSNRLIKEADLLHLSKLLEQLPIEQRESIMKQTINLAEFYLSENNNK